MTSIRAKGREGEASATGGNKGGAANPRQHPEGLGGGVFLKPGKGGRPIET